MDIVFKTERGLETFLAEDLNGLGNVVLNPFSFEGRVLSKFRSTYDLLYFLYTNRFYHKALLLIDTFKVGKERGWLDEIYFRVRRSDVLSFISSGKSIAVRSVRKGSHEYTSQEIAAYAGAAIVDGCILKRGFRPRVNLDDPDIIINCDVANDTAILGIELVGYDSMHKRGWHIFYHPAAIKATIASSMIRLSGYKGKGIFIDPMCGSGTIPIEAALMVKNVPAGYFRKTSFSFLRSDIFQQELWDEVVRVADGSINWKKQAKILASDRIKKYINGAVQNSQKAGVYDSIKFFAEEVKNVRKITDMVDFCVVNPPYGIRLLNQRQVAFIINELFLSIADVLSADGVFVIIHPDYELITEFASLYGFVLDKVIDAYNGNVKVNIFKFIR